MVVRQAQRGDGASPMRIVLLAVRLDEGAAQVAGVVLTAGAAVATARLTFGLALWLASGMTSLLCSAMAGCLPVCWAGGLCGGAARLPAGSVLAGNPR